MGNFWKFVDILRCEKFENIMKQKYEGQSPSYFCVVEVSKLTFQNINELSKISHGSEFIAKLVENNRKLAINYQFQKSNYEPNKFKICSKRLNVGHENPKTEKCWKFWRSKILEDAGDTRYAYPRISHWPLSFWIPKTLHL